MPPERNDDRIVSIWFPHMRPIKRGKANADTEFGAKLHVSMVQGFVFVERIDWNNFNEGTNLIQAMENYRRRFGYYPKSVHADKIYRNRKNLDYCKKKRHSFIGCASHLIIHIANIELTPRIA